MKAFKVTTQAIWDDVAEVWVATSDDVPGLITEAATQHELIEKLKVMIPELLNLNGMPSCDDHVPIELLVQSEQRLAIGC